MTTRAAPEPVWIVIVAHVPRAPEYCFASFAGMVIEDSGVDSPWLFEKTPWTVNLMLSRKVTAGSLWSLMPRDLDTFMYGHSF